MPLEKTMLPNVTDHSEPHKMKPFANCAKQCGDENNENDHEGEGSNEEIQIEAPDLENVKNAENEYDHPKVTLNVENKD